MKRIMTSLVLFAIAMYVMIFGGFPLWCWTALLALLTTYEVLSMFSKKEIAVYSGLAYGSVFTILLTLLLPKAMAIWSSFPVRLVAIGLILMYIIELTQKKLFVMKSPLFNTFRVILLISGTFPFIYLLREGNMGNLLFILGCLVIWAIDIVALIVGRKYGKRLLNSVSPKKTVEGAIGGTIAGLIVGMIVGFIAGSSPLSPLYFLGIACPIAFLAQVGDLHESLIKRYCGVKDSSQLLPGHGGIYDRADSTLFVAPILFFLFN